jgi:hypothetical protein
VVRPGKYPLLVSVECRVPTYVYIILQSWWPDGEYTAPTDDALKFDLLAVKQFGLNAVRLHQKVNSDRWYYYADSLGVVILQDMIQKYGGATPATVLIFMTELKAMLDGLYNHPSIIQVSCISFRGACLLVNAACPVV